MLEYDIEIVQLALAESLLSEALDIFSVSTSAYVGPIFKPKETLIFITEKKKDFKQTVSVFSVTFPRIGKTIILTKALASHFQFFYVQVGASKTITQRNGLKLHTYFEHNKSMTID
jgi:hypothetical protein